MRGRVTGRKRGIDRNKVRGVSFISSLSKWFQLLWLGQAEARNKNFIRDSHVGTEAGLLLLSQASQQGSGVKQPDQDLCPCEMPV